MAVLQPRPMFRVQIKQFRLGFSGPSLEYSVSKTLPVLWPASLSLLLKYQDREARCECVTSGATLKF